MTRALVLTLLAGRALAAEVESDAPPAPKIDLAVSLTSCDKLDPTKKLRLTLKGEVGATELVAALAPLSCRPIVIAGSAPRTNRVLIDAPDLLTPKEAVDLLVTALDSLGLSLEESGRVLRVVDSARGKEIASDSAHGREAFVLHVLHLVDASAEEVASTLGKLRSKDGEVIALPQSRSVLVVDRQAQVERMEALVRALDRPALPAHMFVLPTHRQRPSELVDPIEKVALQTVPHGDKDPARPQLIAVDAARVILFAGSPTAFLRVQALLDRIDPPLVPGEEHGGRIAVYYLKHANAEDLVVVLKEVLTQAKSTRSGQSGTGASSAPIALSTMPSAGAIDGEVKITADKEENALVATGSASDLESVRELVGQLDMPRRQVYVEAAVLDVSADLSRALGLAFSQTGATSTGAGIVSSSSATVTTLNTTQLAATAAGGGLLAGFLGNSVNVAGQTIPSFGVVLQALEKADNTSVLSRPHLLTLDHQKATISVGQKIPFPTNSLTGVASASALATSTSYTREEVALTFDLTPHLSDDETMRLEINGEISDVDNSAAVTAGGPTTNQRKLKTTVIVKDGETIVLGGLTKETASESVSKIPYLGDIPLLGKLFQTKSKSRAKQDLLIIITPYVIRDQSDLRRIYERKERERREMLERSSMFGDPNAYDPHVDYARKRGLLEEINTVARIAEVESRALEEARLQLGRVRSMQPGEVLLR